MKFARRGLITRALVGFVLGIFICAIYWMTGGISREIWFDARWTAQLIMSKMWFWPGGVLDVVFRDTQPYIAAAALYVINGLMYMAISTCLFALRERASIYILLCATVVGMLTWFNASVMQTFSWVWFVVVVVALGIVSYRDLRVENGKSKGLAKIGDRPR